MRALAGAVWVVGLAVVALAFGACGTQRSPAPAAGVRALVVARALAQADPRLAKALAAPPAGEGFATRDAGWASGRGRPAGPPGEIRARLPRSADGAFEIGAGAARVELKVRGATAAAGRAEGGQIAYADALGEGLDLALVASPTAVEALVVLHEERDRFALALELQPATDGRAVRVTRNDDGSVTILDSDGRESMRVPPAYAVDSRGTRRNATLSWDEGTRALSVRLEARGLAFPVLLDPAFESFVWDPSPAMSRRQGHAMVYDGARREIVLFGGTGVRGTPSGETWIWDGTRWSRRAPATSPAPRSGHAMAFDAARGRVVLFGGATKYKTTDETWLWDGATWTLAAPTKRPPTLTGHAMAYDEARQQVVLFGGAAPLTSPPTAPYDDTWTWDGTNWTLAAPTKRPTARAGHAMAYDAPRSRVVLFGGTDIDGRVVGDTWLWSGSDWAQPATATAPSARAAASMALDVARGRVALFGGGDTMPQADLWEWNGSAWSLVATPTAPPARAYGTMAYDATRGALVLFGGDTGVGTSGDTWTRAAAWVEADHGAPTPRSGAGMVYDPVRGATLLFGGQDASNDARDTWVWNGARWTELRPAASPPAQAVVTVTFDTKRARAILLADIPNTGTETWSWDGAAWTKVASGSTPPWRSGRAIAYDAARDEVVTFGGTAFGTHVADTWTWNGATWTQRTPAKSPPALTEHVMVYEAARARVLLFGGRTPAATLNETWAWDGSTWSQLSPGVAPTPRTGAAAAYDSARKQVILFGGDNQGDTWIWDGTTWAAAATSGPDGRSRASLAFDAARGRMVMFGGDSVTALDVITHDDLWLLRSRGGSCAASADCDTGYCVDGVCCETASCGTCQACDLATPGICSPVRSAPDLDSCGGACDAAGVCRAGLGAACTQASECASGHCVDGVCCGPAACGFCEACSAALKASGSSGTCGPAKAGVDPRGDCPDEGAASCRRDGQCDGRSACRLYAQGTSCGASRCERGRATGQLCDGLGACAAGAGVDCAPYVCEAATGACSTPCARDDQCTATHTCDGGACVPRLALGAKCASPRACPLGALCVDGVCCSAPCGRQCEACDVAGLEGTCVPVVGPPRGGRPACGDPANADVCKRAACDGIERASCRGYDASHTCRAPTCLDGVAVLAATCDGLGGCPAEITKPCFPYVCGPDRCKDACATDADCAPGNRCDTATNKCVSGATCDGDHTLTGATGTKTDCAPYRCGDAGCRTECQSVVDCVAPAVCGVDHRCTATDGPTGQGSGCALGRGGEGLVWLLPPLLLGVRRRRALRQGRGG